LILSRLLLALSGQLVAVYRLQQRRTRRVWFTGPSNSVTNTANPKKMGSSGSAPTPWLCASPERILEVLKQPPRNTSKSGPMHIRSFNHPIVTYKKVQGKSLYHWWRPSARSPATVSRTTLVALRGRGSSTGIVQSHHCNFGSVLLETWLDAMHRIIKRNAVTLALLMNCPSYQ
jgi:hypothetical protein